MKKVKPLLLAMAVFCAIPTVSIAAKCGGTNINHLVASDSTEISKGTTLTTVRLTSVIVSEDANAAYHLLAGECIGALLRGPDGKTQGSGNCSRKDKDGDVLNEEWAVSGGKGTSKFAGGTGKFSAAGGTTQWESTPLQGKTSAVRWTGNCQ